MPIFICGIFFENGSWDAKVTIITFLWGPNICNVTLSKSITFFVSVWKPVLYSEKTHGLLAFLKGGDRIKHTSDCFCTGSDNSHLILLTVGNSSSDQNVNSGEFNYQFKNLHTGNVMWHAVLQAVQMKSFSIHLCVAECMTDLHFILLIKQNGFCLCWILLCYYIVLCYPHYRKLGLPSSKAKQAKIKDKTSNKFLYDYKSADLVCL